MLWTSWLIKKNTSYCPEIYAINYTSQIKPDIWHEPVEWSLCQGYSPRVVEAGACYVQTLCKQLSNTTESKQLTPCGQTEQWIAPQARHTGQHTFLFMGQSVLTMVWCSCTLLTLRCVFTFTNQSVTFLAAVTDKLVTCAHCVGKRVLWLWCMFWVLMRTSLCCTALLLQCALTEHTPATCSTWPIF